MTPASYFSKDWCGTNSCLCTYAGSQIPHVKDLALHKALILIPSKLVSSRISGREDEMGSETSMVSINQVPLTSSALVTSAGTGTDDYFQMVLVSALLGVLKEWTPSYGHRGGYLHLEDAGAQVLGVSHKSRTLRRGGGEAHSKTDPSQAAMGHGVNQNSIDWIHRRDDHLVRSIEIAFMSPITPFVVIRDLSEFREHVEQPLPIYHSTLGEYSMKFLAYAKALHYKELATRPSSRATRHRLTRVVDRARVMLSELEEVIMYQQYADQPERQQMKRVRTLIINPEDGAYGVHQICEPVSQVAPHESGGEDDQFAAYSTQALTLVRVHTTTTRKPRRTWSTLSSSIWGRKAQPRRTPTVRNHFLRAVQVCKSAGGDPRSYIHIHSSATPTRKTVEAAVTTPASNPRYFGAQDQRVRD
ncbi:hypothetical protein C8R44DRAFT_753964 [Mycena epipterygia]|nr:hypothetical protein C8R44DRAFT_753964 [Mycena epipterygia]